MKNFSSFLGANTPQGFVSFFDELYNPYQNSRAYIIKGGPGTGKSTFMKKLADECDRRGFDTERVYCSSDPSSLDGVIVPALYVAVGDGTAPHVMEPKFPGASENIINTGDFWDKKALYDHAEEIRALTLENSLHHRRSARYLAAAGSINDETLRLSGEYIDRDKLEGFALRLASRELPKIKNAPPGKKSKRFISAISPKGLIFLDKSIEENCTRIIGIEDEYSPASSLLADRLGELAVARGYDVIFCHCPMKPKMPCEHIIIPGANLAFVTLKSTHRIEVPVDRIIHSCRFFTDGYKTGVATYRMNRRLITELTREAVISLKRAKEVHDRLEKIYSAAMNFDALDAYGDRLTADILSTRVHT